jgi:diguanylate cyclase (GGDEF)-like protein
VPGHTTTIQRVLERRAPQHAQIEDGTTTTLAVMLRVLPPPKALVVVESAAIRDQVQRYAAASVIDADIAPETAQLEPLLAKLAPIIVTDNQEFVRRVRDKKLACPPFILFVAELDEAHEREVGLAAGADEAIARGAAEREWCARLLSARRIVQLEAVLRATLADNRRLSTLDDLTRVASRRFFGKHFPREVARAARAGRPLAVVLCDIDDFKKINDSRGHMGGDDVLKEFGPRIQKVLRAGVDWVARIGGEEFAIVLPETGFDAALETARRLRTHVAQSPFRVQRRSLKVTASFGVCALDKVPSRELETAQRMLKAADAALYRSKREGRDRVTGVGLLPAEGSE